MFRIRLEWINHKIQGTYVQVRKEGLEVREIRRNKLYGVDIPFWGLKIISIWYSD